MLGPFEGAIEDGDGGAAVAQGEDGGTGGTACTEHEDGCAVEDDATGEWVCDAGGVGVAAGDGDAGIAAQGVGGTEFCGEWMEAIDARKHLLLEGHGDACACEVEAMEGFEEFVGAAGFEWKVDGVGAGFAEGGVEHDGRVGAGDGIAEDSIEFRVGGDVFDAVEIAQGAEVDLAGGGGRGGVGGGEGEDGAEARAEDAGEDAGLAHGHRDHVLLCGVRFEEVGKGEAVAEGGCGGDDFVEVRRVRSHAVVDGFEIGGGVEVVPAQEEGRGAVAQGIECGAVVFGEGLRGFEREVDEVCACCCGLREQVEFVFGCAGEMAPVGGAAAGCDEDDLRAVLKEMRELREDGCWVGCGVETEFEEGVFCGEFGGTGEHGRAGEGDADAGEFGAEAVEFGGGAHENDGTGGGPLPSIEKSKSVRSGAKMRKDGATGATCVAVGVCSQFGLQGS